MTLLLIITASLLIGTVSWSYSLGWLSFVALMPIFLLAKRLSGKKLLAAVWAVGLISSLLTWAWLLTTKPEVWAGIDGWLAVTLVYLAWVLTSLFYSLGILPFALLLARYRINPTDTLALITLPAAWVIGEFARSWLFSFVHIGPGGTLGAHWNFGSFGFAASVTPLASLSRYAGMFGLSFVVILINILIWRILVLRRRLLPLLGLIAICAMAGVGWWQHKATIAPQQIGLLSLAEGDANYDEQIRTHDSPSKLFVLPEYSFFFSDDSDRSADLRRLITPDGLIINAGLEHNRLFTDHHSLVTYRNQDGTIVSNQEKSFLIPTGEYLPYWIEWLLRQSGNAPLVQKFNQINQITPGNTPEYSITAGGMKIGTLSCSGVITPTFYQRLAKDGAQVLVNSAALNIFSGSPLYYQQNRQIARFQAVANARPFIQAAKSGPSYVVSADGAFIEEVEPGQTKVVTAQIQSGESTTLYSQLGEWAVILSGLILLTLQLTGLGLTNRQK